MIFMPSCMVRLPPALVMNPNVLLPMFVSGLFHCGVFRELKLSPRSCNESFSPILTTRNAEKLVSHKPGPLITFGPRFPNCKFPGCAKQFEVMDAVQMAGSNHA